MRHFIIDTNFVYLDFFLRGTNITALTGSADKLGHIVYIPQVVFDELCKQYYEEIDVASEAERKYFKALNRVNPIVSKYTSANFDRLKSSYEEYLAKKCDHLGIYVLDYPKVEHRKMVLRELNQRKPFKDSTKGYRDSLIWETILAFGKRIGGNDTVVFLTENTDDFAKDKTQLHPDLIADCSKDGITEGKICLKTGFHSFITNEILPAAEQMKEKFQELLQNFSVGNIDIHDIVDKYLNIESLQHLFEYSPDYGQSQYVPGVYENVILHYMSPYNMTIYDVRRISDDNVLISVRVDFDLFMDCFIFKSDLPLIDDNDIGFVSAKQI